MTQGTVTFIDQPNPIFIFNCLFKGSFYSRKMSFTQAAGKLAFALLVAFTSFDVSFMTSCIPRFLFTHPPHPFDILFFSNWNVCLYEGMWSLKFVYYINICSYCFCICCCFTFNAAIHNMSIIIQLLSYISNFILSENRPYQFKFSTFCVSLLARVKRSSIKFLY